MRFFKFNGRSLTFLTIMFVGALIATSLGSMMSVQAASTSTVPLGDGSYVSVAYTISKDSSGYTCAKNSATGAIDFRDTNSRTVIQKAVDKLSGGYVYIKAGTYYMTNCIYTNKVSIVGDGNATILKANGIVGAGIIRVCDNYWTLDYRYMSSRPNGVTVANLQVNGQSGGPMKGVCFIDCLNCRMIRLYVHDIQACQGLYMSNSPILQHQPLSGRQHRGQLRGELWIGYRVRYRIHGKDGIVAHHHRPVLHLQGIDVLHRPGAGQQRGHNQLRFP